MAVLIGVSLFLVRSGRQGATQLEMLTSAEAPLIAIDADTERRITAFCSACHAMPVAASFARDAWHHEVMRGYQFYATSGRTDLDAPAPYLTIAYFRSKASETVVLPTQTDDDSPSQITFRPVRAPLDKSAPVPPAVAHLKWLPQTTTQTGTLVQCDMQSGVINAIDLRTTTASRHANERVGFPCHAEPCDLNLDGHLDLVIADLGSFLPDDHQRGRVIWMRGGADGNWTAETLAENLGRVADVRPIDLDLDGDLDLVVGEFGWHSTGGILVLSNQSSEQQSQVKAPPVFQIERIDSRPGTIHVPCADLDHDGRPDIVALLSQEHERVELFLNRADQPWQARTLWAAPDPAFGMSGLELVDFDLDGDLDVLFTNGDTFDSMTLKPSHGIQWLRNDGDLKFVYQRIANMSGVYSVRAGDFDRDGDLDVIASAWMPGKIKGDETFSGSHAVLVLFEQTAPMKFDRRTLQRGHPSLATIEVGDFDRDGDLDFAVNSHITRFDESNDGLVVWWNESKSR